MNRPSQTTLSKAYAALTQLSASQLVQAIARIEQVNPTLNAVVVKRYEAARAEAQAADERRKAGDELGFFHGNSRELLSAGAYACLYVEKVALKTEQGSVGLSIGVQVIACTWREHVALATLCALERLAQTRTDFPQTPVSLA